MGQRFTGNQACTMSQKVSLLTAKSPPAMVGERTGAVESPPRLHGGLECLLKLHDNVPAKGNIFLRHKERQ